MPGRLKVSAWFLALALAATALGDLSVGTQHPWFELGRMARGLLRPDFGVVPAWHACWTVAFAVLGVGLGATLGLPMALMFARSRAIRLLAAGLRSIHELFWALLLMQVAGLSPLTGVLAIGLPYAGIFAKVFAEIMEEAVNAG